jgi:hypothetical protein
MYVMLEKDRQVPMRQRMNPDRYYTDYRQAAGLLRADLIWSNDFDGIRIPLANLIATHAAVGNYPEPLTEIVQQLIATENDLTI